MKKTYRVHLTCKGKHSTYQDYKTKTSAALASFTGIMGGWWCYKVEIL